MITEPTARKGVEFAIQTEQIGEKVYRRLARQFGDHADVAKLFSDLADAEKAHQQQFAALLSVVAPDPQVTNLEERLEYLRATSISEFFKGEDGLTRRLDAIRTKEDALTRALEFEKDTLVFQYALREVVGHTNALNAIVEAEKNHVARIATMLSPGAS